MPECRFYAKFGHCNRPDCPYLHVPPEEKAKECPWYIRGFCKHGPRCHHRHVRRMLCEDYMAGFCPRGPDCPLAHPKWEAPREESATVAGPGRFSSSAGSLATGGSGGGGAVQTQQRQPLVCYRCGQPGHKAINCPNATTVPARMPPQQAPFGGGALLPAPQLQQQFSQPHW